MFDELDFFVLKVEELISLALDLLSDSELDSSNLLLSMNVVEEQVPVSLNCDQSVT